jgi:hypothetical protein
MKGINVFKIVFFVLAPVVLASFLFWAFQEKKPTDIYVLDKTVPDETYAEHKSFDWILTYYKYTKRNKKLYSYKKDYYGYLPGKHIRNPIRSLRLYEILSLSDDFDMVYYTDTYGVTYQDVFNRPPDRFNSPLIYGGLNQNDYLLLSEMKRKHKLILTEFNILASPTSDLVREKTESLFDFSWTGWTGCYISSLKSTNPNLPRWLISQYEQKYQKKWAFDGEGIILVQENGDIVVLDAKTYLNHPFPQIITGAYGQKTYHLPSSQNYSFWFDIIKPGQSNKVVSSYKINTNSEGDKLLGNIGLTKEFPAIIEHLGDYKFYYFAGDFCDRDIAFGTSYFKGFPWLAKTFYLRNSASKKAFFWRFYLPLIHNILEKNLLITAKTG